MNATNRAVCVLLVPGDGLQPAGVPGDRRGGVPGPIARMADSLLQNLMEETKRLVREKEYAIHAVAEALLEHGELIGQELEDVFLQADLEHAEPGSGRSSERSSPCRSCSRTRRRPPGCSIRRRCPRRPPPRCGRRAVELSWHDLH